MTKREGPELTIEASCYDCKYNRSDYYVVQSDSGHITYCDHPNVGPKRIGDSDWNTPEWCPFLKVALDELIESKTNNQ